MKYKIGYCVEFSNGKTENHFSVFESKTEDISNALEQFKTLFKKKYKNIDFKKIINFDIQKIVERESEKGILFSTLDLIKPTMFIIYTPYFDGEDIKLSNIGYIFGYFNLNADDCWKICNWSAYTDTKPENLYADIDSCSTDVVFQNVDTGLFYIPLGFDWAIANTKEESLIHIKKNKILVDYMKTKYIAKTTKAD